MVAHRLSLKYCEFNLQCLCNVFVAAGALGLCVLAGKSKENWFGIRDAYIGAI